VGSAAGGLAGGGKVIDTTDEPKASTLVDLNVKLDMDVLADSFTLIMGQVGSFRPERDQQVDIELGFDDDNGMQKVMTGALVTVEPGLITRRLNGLSPAHLLLKTFVETFFEEKTAGDIVKELASQAGVQTADVENGIRFPAYAVDGRRSAYHHLRRLADLCGFDLYIDFEGKLVFKKFVGGRIVHVFEFAKHILELEVLQSQPRAAAVEAWGESPGSGPTESWAWLTKDFAGSKGSAGSGSPKYLLERPALRTPTAAQQAADAAFTHFKRQAKRGRLLLTGSPQVRLGDALRLQGVPETSLNATYQVRAVTHRLTKLGGYTTEVQFRSIE
jgi:phage protein D